MQGAPVQCAEFRPGVGPLPGVRACAAGTCAQVVAAGPKDMRMFYHSFCARTQRWTVGWASSQDGFSWRRQGALFSGGDDAAAFDGGGAAACHVVRDFATERCARGPKCHAACRGCAFASKSASASERGRQHLVVSRGDCTTEPAFCTSFLDPRRVGAWWLVVVWLVKGRSHH